MALQAGDALWGGWTVGDALPARGGLLRWRAHQQDRVGEVSLPSPSARLRDPSQDRARRAGTLPGRAECLSVELGPVGDAVARISAPTRSLPAELRLEPAVALALLRWLGPAVAESGSALGGELDAQDLVLALDGTVLLSPCGLNREESLARLPLHRAPEWSPGSTCGTAALYGLGAFVYRAVTGRSHLAAPNRGALDAARQAPLPALQANPRLPPSLAETLDALVSPEPTARRAAVEQLGPSSAVVLPDEIHEDLAAVQGAPRPAERALPAPEAQVTARPSGSTRDLPLQDWVVFFEPAQATRRARRRLAALLEVDDVHLKAEHPLVVADGRSRDDAEAAARRLSRATDALTVRPRPTGQGRAFALLGLAGGLAATALVLPALWAAVSLVGAVGSLVGAKALRGRSAPQGASSRVLATRWSQLQEAVGQPSGQDARAQALARLQATRRALLLSELNPLMKGDLLDGVDALDEQLQTVTDPDGSSEIDAVLRVLASLETALAAAPANGLEAASIQALEGRVRAAAATLTDPSA